MGLPQTVSVTKAAAAAGDYAAEDVISESATVGTAWNFNFGSQGVSGFVTKAVVMCETTNLTHRLTLFLFRATPTSALNDNVANTAVLHADAGNFLGQIDFPALSDLGGDSVAVATPSTVGNVPLAVASDGTGSIYGILVTRDAITGETATDDYIISLTLE